MKPPDGPCGPAQSFVLAKRFSLTAFFVTIQYCVPVRCQAAQIKGLCTG